MMVGEAMPTHLNATPVVCYLQQLQPALLSEDVQRGSAGIDGILNKFLECMNRSNNDFASSDFVDNIRIERLMFMLVAEPGRMREALAWSSFTYLDSARRTGSFRQSLGFPFCTTRYDIMNLIGAWDTSHIHICVCCHRLWPIPIETTTFGRVNKPMTWLSKLWTSK
jgi:hypothetical protein